MWIDVIAKMDEVYADLIRYETDLEAKNAALEEAQAFISSVIASVSDILIVVDAAGVVVQVNPAFVRLTELPDADLVGAVLPQLVAPECRAGLAALMPTAGEARDGELRFRTREGTSDLMAVACSPRVDHAGRRAGAVLTGRPVGELRRAYEALHLAHEQLQQAQNRLVAQEKMASLGRLVAGVAHELNNPISFVYGNIHALDRYRRRFVAFFDELAEGGAPSELRRRHRIDAMLTDLQPLIDGTLEGAERISDIVRNLRRLSFARLGAHEDVPLQRVVRNAALWASRAKGEAGCVEVIAPDEVVVEGQEGRLHQVIVNLVENALDAVRGRPDPRVTVELAVLSDWVEIRVRDNGAGVDPLVADKIFEPFFTTKQVGEGTGLGLWISYAIAREHNGELLLRPSDDGALFVLRLPRRG